jgi:hypothetical protein
VAEGGEGGAVSAVSSTEEQTDERKGKKRRREEKQKGIQNSTRKKRGMEWKTSPSKKERRTEPRNLERQLRGFAAG